MTLHIDKHYEQELQQLKDAILKMGGIVEEMLQKSMKALAEHDMSSAKNMIGTDDEVNQLEMDIDNRCLKLLALHQPTASDLRFITIGLKISKDLERMGDLAVNIGQHTLNLYAAPKVNFSEKLVLLAQSSQNMVKQALDAFVTQDVAQAQKVCEEDDIVDQYNKEIQEQLIEFLKHHPESLPSPIHILLIARQFERIADHATNIAEEVIFMAQGKDIRHGGH